MLQITTLNTAKPASSGMEILAGASGETQDSSGFEGILSTQMENAASTGMPAGDASKLTPGKVGGKAAGKATGKILPVGLPESQDLPSVDGDAAAIGLPGLSMEGKKKGEEKSSENSSHSAPDQVPSIVLPQLAVSQPATVAGEALATDNQAPASVPVRPSLPKAVERAASPVPAAILPMLHDGMPSAARAVNGQEAKAIQAAANPAIAVLSGNAPVSLDSVAKEAGPLPTPTGLPIQSMPAQAMPVQSMPVQAISAQSMPATAVAVGHFVLAGEAIRLHPATNKAAKLQTETPAAPTVETASLLPTPAEDTAVLVPGSASEGASITSTFAKQAASVSGLSTKESLEAPKHLSVVAEARQDATAWFDQSAQAQPSGINPAGHISHGHTVERPHDFEALVDRLVAAREFATPAPVYASIAHSEFGQVSLKFEHGDQGLTVAASSPDPDFARAVQAAAPSDRNSSGFDSRDSNAGGNSMAYRQDTLSQSDNGAQAQSRNAGGSDRLAGDNRRHRSEDTTSSQAKNEKPRRDGIFA